MIDRSRLVFSKIAESDWILSIYKKDRKSKIDGSDSIFCLKKGGKTVKNIWQIHFIRSNRSFLWSKDWFDLENYQIDIFLRSTWSIRSFLKIKKIERSKIERSNSQPCIVSISFPLPTYGNYFLGDLIDEVFYRHQAEKISFFHGTKTTPVSMRY